MDRWIKWLLPAAVLCLTGCNAVDSVPAPPADSVLQQSSSCETVESDTSVFEESSPESVSDSVFIVDSTGETVPEQPGFSPLELLPEINPDLYYHTLVTQGVQNDTAVLLYYFGDGSTDATNPQKAYVPPFYLAVHQTGEDVDFFRFDPSYDLEAFRSDHEYTVTCQGSTAAVVCPELYTTLTLDFTAGTATLSHGQFPTVPNTEHIAVSKDGAYTVDVYGHWGGGDIVYRQFILRENATGKTKYLGTTGGMYSGVWDAGFMSNGDIYLLRNDDFLLYDRDMENTAPIFRLGQNFSFGDNVDERIRERTLLAARRDPVAYTYLGLYIEHLHEYAATGYMLNPDENVQLQMKATYKVGMFDTNGHLIREYDTGVHAVRHMGLANVDMYLTDGDQLHIISKSRGDIYTQGVLNLTTGVYTPEKEMDWG